MMINISINTLVLLIVFGFVQCIAAPAYTYESCSHPFNDISTQIGNGATRWYARDDDVLKPVQIGFSFKFYGVDYSAVLLGSNGFMSFDLTTNTNCCGPDSIPNPSRPNNWILMYQEDMDPANGNGNEALVYSTQGAAPNRRFIYQFTNIPEFPNLGANTFQAVLYETTNKIQLRYLTLNAATTNGDVPSIGIENADGTEGIRIDGNTVSGGTCIQFNDNSCPVSGTANPCFDIWTNHPCTSVNIAAQKFYHPSCTSRCNFIQCDAHGGMWDMKCSEGTVWNSDITACDFPPAAAKSVGTLNNDLGDIDVKNNSNNHYYEYIILIGVVAFVLVNNIFIGYWCLGKNKGYSKVKFEMVGDDEEI